MPRLKSGIADLQTYSATMNHVYITFKHASFKNCFNSAKLTLFPASRSSANDVNKSSGWNIGCHRPLFSSFSSVPCCRLHLPPALYLYPAVLSPSPDLFSRCSLVVLFQYGHEVSAGVLEWQCSPNGTIATQLLITIHETIFTVLSSTVWSHMREFTLGPMSESQSVPGGCQLLWQAAN